MTETWQPPADVVELPAGMVHLWRASLARPTAQRLRLAQFLAPDELERAARFHFAHDRQEYVVGRGLLRWLHGRYRHILPTDIRFTYNDYGKPSVAQDDGWQFNISHSHGKILIGFCRSAEIGVDIEQIRLPDHADELARRFFSAAEAAAFALARPEQRAEAFFNCWTRKEAYIKAIGEGLSCPLSDFDVALLPEEPARLQRIRGDERLAAGWTMWSLTPFPGYRGAVLVAGQGWELVCWDGDLLDYF